MLDGPQYVPFIDRDKRKCQYNPTFKARRVGQYLHRSSLSWVGGSKNEQDQVGLEIQIACIDFDQI